MAGVEPEPYAERKRTFRKPWMRWMVMGALAVALGAVYNGSDLHPLVEKAMGPRSANAITFLAGLAGVLVLLWGGLTLCEHTAVSEAAIEQFSLGRQTLRFLWKDLERITLLKAIKRPKGPIELRKTDARTLLVDPRLNGFDLLEQAILERAEFFGIDVRDQRG